MLKTNIPILMTAEDRVKYSRCNSCNLCKKMFTHQNHKVADRSHLLGKFRQVLCNACNLKLQQPKFITCYLHNLSNDDAHFIIRELDYDSNSITVNLNSKEKSISFSKYISKYFSIRFIHTYRFMTSSLSALTYNLNK